MIVPFNEQGMTVEGERIQILRKNISLPLAIPSMVRPWGKLPREDCAKSVLRYCHNPQIGLRTPKGELIFPSMFVVRVRVDESNLRMVKVWIRLARTPQHST